MERATNKRHDGKGPANKLQERARSKRPPNFMKPRMVRQVIKVSGLFPTTIAFGLLFVAATLVVAAVEPRIANIGDAAWFLFTVVTTVGLGDYTCVTLIGRLTTVLLSLYSVFFLAVLTGAVVSYCSELMQARQDESVAHFLDQLERLPELSHEELVAISEKVKRF